MRRVIWKIAAALLTFLIGTVLTLAWHAAWPKTVVSLGVSGAPVISTDPDFLKGRSDAERDIKAGNLTILAKGQTYFGKVLKDELGKYGVEIGSIGCYFKENQVRYMHGYNEVSKAAIDARFGDGVAEEAIRQATEQDHNYNSAE